MRSANLRVMCLGTLSLGAAEGRPAPRLLKRISTHICRERQYVLRCCRFGPSELWGGQKAEADVVKSNRDAVRRPRTPLGVRFLCGLVPGGGSLRLLTPG